MNDDNADDDYYSDMDRLLPREISDGAATVLCDFLAELAVIAETRYSPHCRRYRESLRPPVDPQHPWRNLDSD